VSRRGRLTHEHVFKLKRTRDRRGYIAKCWCGRVVQAGEVRRDGHIKKLERGMLGVGVIKAQRPA